MLLDGHKCLKKTEKNKNEIRSLYGFVKIIEWLIERANISKNWICYVINEGAVSRNAGVTTFGPPCTSPNA